METAAIMRFLGDSRGGRRLARGVRRSLACKRWDLTMGDDQVLDHYQVGLAIWDNRDLVSDRVPTESR